MGKLKQLGIIITQKKTALKQKYQPLLSQYYMVKLEESLGSIEKVLDEYLLSLQVDIDFDKYFTDKKSYNKLRKKAFKNR